MLTGITGSKFFPGSGGWGIILGLYGYREIVPRLNAFLTGAYTITPAENYTPTASSVAGYTDYSIADSYSGRGGFEYLVWPSHPVWLSLAGRIDGVPVNDLAGGSQGFRRPGHSVAIDPGVSASYKSWTFSFNTPVAVSRARLQNVTELATGAPAAAAGFAEIQVLFNISKRF